MIGSKPIKISTRIQSIFRFLYFSRREIANVSLRVIIYGSIMMCISMVARGSWSVLQFITTYVLPYYQNA